MSNFFNVIVLKAEEKTLKFHKKRIIFGTIVSSDVRLNSNTIDPIHAVLEKGKIFDLASNLGVMVNDDENALEMMVETTSERGNELYISLL